MTTELAEHLKHDRFIEHVGIERFLCDNGTWSARLTVEPKHLNGLGIIQGGAVFTLADHAFAIASNTDDRTSVGLQTSMSFLAPAKEGDMLTAHVREVSRRRTVSLYEVEIVNEQSGDLIALFTGTAYTLHKVK
ncbi:MAG: hotdog fold thioesterase [Kiritimatiellales bacterium]